MPGIPKIAARAVAYVGQRGSLALPGPASVRRGVTEGLSVLTQGARGIERTDWELGGIPTRTFARPDASPEHGVIYMHGGGFELGSKHTHGAVASQIAAGTGVPVHLIAYRRAPEHRHPDAILDTMAAYRALLARGLDSGNVVLAGDSCGAALALGAAMRLRDGGEPEPRLLVLLCPWLDLSLSGDSVKKNRLRDAGLNESWLRRCAEAYAPDHDDLADPDISPAYGLLTGLPPIHLQQASEDILASDCDLLMRRAREAGVEIDHRRYEGVWHGFQLVGGTLVDARRALDDATRTIRTVLGRGEPPRVEEPKHRGLRGLFGR